MVFSVHGKVNAFFDENSSILHIHITTPVNEEFFVECEAVLEPIRKSIKTPQWASLVNVKGDALAPPEAIPMMKKSIQQAVSDGIIATAVIFEESDAQLIFKEFWHGLYIDSGLEHDFFENEEQAKQWLLTLLANN
jgi:hypothetical protein